ncbi:MAG: methyltransferase, partial [Candidatus Competibacteraceae bacterium]|nr:methyltransferase [Candidatus Competibacteraceae bacterium]
MNSRERVRAALAHRQPDRVPIDFGGTFITGMHCSTVAAMRDHFGLPRQPVKIHEPYQMLGWIDSEPEQGHGA